MDWIVESMIEAILLTISKALDFLTSFWLENFSLDIGLFDENGQATGLFDQFFPLAQGMQPLFLATGLGLMISIFFYQLYKNFLGPLSDAEHPLSLAGRFLLTSVLTYYSYEIFVLMQGLARPVYEQFWEVKDSSKFTFTAFNTQSVVDSVQAAAIGVPVEASIVLVQLAFTAAVGFGYVALLLEIAERYILLGVMFYTAPLAFATLASNSTKTIFQAWLKLLVTLYFTMMLHVFFLRVFVSALTTAPSIYETPWDYILWNLCLMGFLFVGKRVDVHLSSLGLNYARSTDNLISVFHAMAIDAKKMGKTASRSLKRSAAQPQYNNYRNFQGSSVFNGADARTTAQNTSIMNQKPTNAKVTTMSGNAAVKASSNHFNIKPTGNEDLDNCSFGAGQAKMAYKDGSALYIRAGDDYRPLPGFISQEMKGADGFKYYLSGSGDPQSLSKLFGADTVSANLQSMCDNNPNLAYRQIMNGENHTGAFELKDTSTGSILQYSPTAMYDTSSYDSSTQNFNGFDWNITDVTNQENLQGVLGTTNRQMYEDNNAWQKVLKYNGTEDKYSYVHSKKRNQF